MLPVHGVALALACTTAAVVPHCVLLQQRVDLQQRIVQIATGLDRPVTSLLGVCVCVAVCDSSIEDGCVTVCVFLCVCVCACVCACVGRWNFGGVLFVLLLLCVCAVDLGGEGRDPDPVLPPLVL
jgi:hypothetical protein